MIVYIHSHEIEDRGYTMGRHSGVGDIVHIIVPEGTSVSGIASLVTARVTHASSIWTLIFNGHGDDNRSGTIYIGGWIDASNVIDLAPINPLMNRRGRGVELHCCRAAASTAMISAMARTLGVAVMAGVENQVGMRCSSGSNLCLPFGGDTYGRLEGPVAVAATDGSISFINGEDAVVSCP